MTCYLTLTYVIFFTILMMLDFAIFADVLGQLKGGIDKIFDWFKEIFLKGNADKYHLITSSKTPVGIEVSNIIIMSEEKVKLLEIYIDNRLNFDIILVNSAKKLEKNCML